MPLASGGPAGVIFPLLAVDCTIGEGIGALVIATGVVVVDTRVALLLNLEPEGPDTLAVVASGGKVIGSRFGTPLHMF